ncbi:hydrogenase 4 subunit B [Rhodoplanes sp. TEM]|uniref:Hydrogenase 4 subunit B n=1 Tax=Rhodoplanes tepidamans TaxID=200616 RepID=A0ABT5J9I2_RHOTP|nr:MULTISPECIES: hydrogenase 4 subunit B [Rhodoplanes]MDC7785720.1 hydrogenase 4 subunit B [Rhodoplanes tepidamans]MDC7987214.1 hydrogenase 4 subunit B [Rhodoplanes sp. TEM]MDQ0358669.1 formate hydrogenlyase subunit 3/multisubunit Na+/H+ antiporter MnhD subunit [Rhodoplanes tepidamans]
MPEVAIGLWCIAGFLGIGVAATILGGRAIATPLVYGATLLVALGAVLLALTTLLGGAAPSTVVLPIGLPGIGAHFRLDALSAFFMLVVNLGAAAASLYGIGYGRHEHSPMRVLPFFGPFLAGMNLVLLAADAFSFLLSWEFMSLASWTLVVAHHREPANIRAGFIYLAMASFGTLCLLLAFGLLAAPGGDFTFAGMRGATVGGSAAALATLLALVGAGSKAGLVPLHVWLPLAHPAAPSHVSALLSGVMTKVGVYGFIRIVFDVVGDFSSWAGLVVVLAGGATAVLGVLYAVMQRDLKRLLAYSTVENIGIVFIGLGLALAFRANGQGPAAALALTAALFHVFNHSVFKSLLFFGAGAVLTATGERDTEKLGGLIHRMPQTAVVFLIGCMSIAALPPLNGFVSEWLTFQAILLSPQLPQWGLKFAVPAVGAMLALAAALAGACFVKAFGVVFLSRPRSPAAAQATEVDGFALTAMLTLAWICILAGTLPGLVVDALAPVARQLAFVALPPQAGLPWLSLVPIADSRSSYNGLVIFFFLVASGTMTAAVVHRLASRSTRKSPIWDCGYPLDSPVTQYSSSSFAQPIRRVFGTVLFGVHETVDMPRPGETRAGRFRMRVRDPAWRFVYGPLARGVLRGAVRLNRLQFLTIRRYLALVFAALIVLMLVVAIWR